MLPVVAKLVTQTAGEHYIAVLLAFALIPAEQGTCRRVIKSQLKCIFAIGRKIMDHRDTSACSDRRPLHVAILRNHPRD